MTMKYTDNALNILTAKSYKGIGNAWIIKNLGKKESIESIVRLINKVVKCEPTTVEEFENLKRKYESAIVKKMSGYCDGFIALGDENFPEHRGSVKDSEKPVFLYYKGNIDLLSQSNKNISVIGLLNPTIDIEIREKKIVSQLVKNGATIVSGLALGCDSISHREALHSNGNTIAILPSPLTKVQPAANVSLAFQIVEEGGLLITEYGNDFKSKMELNTRYKERDRLQALFCDTIVLVASYSKKSSERWEQLKGQKLDSGARLAMEYAKEYNIPRAVMYHEYADKENPMFDLCREIIQEAKDVTVITQDNYVDTAKSILLNKTKVKHRKEESLFD